MLILIRIFQYIIKTNFTPYDSIDLVDRFGVAVGCLSMVGQSSSPLCVVLSAFHLLAFVCGSPLVCCCRIVYTGDSLGL